MGRVQDSGAAITDRVAAPNGKYNNPESSKVASRYHSRLPLAVITWSDDRIGSLWGKRAICTNSLLFRQTSQRKLINRQRADTDMCPYDGIRWGFLGIQWRCLFVAGILRIHGVTGWTVWALSGDQRIQHVFKPWRFNWCVVSPRGNGHYLLVRQSQLGEAKPLFGCQTVLIGRDKYVIHLMSLFVHMVAAAVDTLWAGDW